MPTHAMRAQAVRGTCLEGATYGAVLVGLWAVAPGVPPALIGQALLFVALAAGALRGWRSSSTRLVPSALLLGGILGLADTALGASTHARWLPADVAPGPWLVVITTTAALACHVARAGWRRWARARRRQLACALAHGHLTLASIAVAVLWVAHIVTLSLHVARGGALAGSPPTAAATWIVTVLMPSTFTAAALLVVCWLAGLPVATLIAHVVVRHFGADSARRVAHDLRTPLAAARLALEEAGGNTGTEPMTRVRQQLDRIERLVGGLLPPRHKHTTRQRCDAARVTARLVRDLRPLAWRRDGVDLLLNADGALHAALSGNALERVLLNIVENALRHTPPGGIVRVSLRAARHQILVDDTGLGFDEAGRDLRAPRAGAAGTGAEAGRTRHVGQGSAVRASGGLGLGIVRDELARVGGHLALRHSPLGGARVVLVLPVPNATHPRQSRDTL